MVDKSSKRPVLAYSTNKHNRIVSQHGLFIHTKDGVLDIEDKKQFIETVTIDKDIKQELREYLLEYLNIDDDTVYNDIHGYINFFESKYSLSYRNQGLADNLIMPLAQIEETVAKDIKLEIEELFSQGNLSFKFGEYNKALDMYQKALDISVQVLGEDHPNTATSYNYLAITLNVQGKYDDAEPLFKKALEIRRQVLGEWHPDTATSYNNIAFNLYAQDKYDDAELLYKKALEISRRILGEDHLGTATHYNNLALNLHAQGKYDDADLLYKKALEISRRVLGENHTSTVTTYNNIALNLHAQGKYDDAEPLLQKALEISYRVLGENHPNTKKCQQNYEDFLAQRKK